MKRKPLLLLLLPVMLTACTSEQVKALDAAVDSNDPAVMREFFNEYADGLRKKLLARYEAAYKDIVQDSALYAPVASAPNVLARYNAARNYIKASEKGPHAKECRQIVSADSAQAKAMSEKLDEMRRYFRRYAFSGPGFTFRLTEPDNNGYGEIIRKGGVQEVYMYYYDRYNNNGYRYGQYDYTFQGSYYTMNDDMQILIHMEESRSGYRTHDDERLLHFDNKWTEQFLQDLRDEYPVKSIHNYVMNFTVADGLPYFTGLEGNENVQFTSSAL